MVHFIGQNKPWTFYRFSDGRVCPRGEFSGSHLEFIQRWWAVRDSLKSSAGETQCRARSPQGPSHSYHGFIADQGHKPAGWSKGCFGQDGMGFANYKITWSADIESHFSQLELKPKASSPQNDGYEAAKIAYKQNGTSSK